MAIKAGADMILMPASFEEAYYGLLAGVLDGNISEERIDESLLRIYKVKYADLVIE
jgi:beta-N-acetylhexosaminidase